MKVKLVPVTEDVERLLDEASSSLAMMSRLNGSEKLMEQANAVAGICRNVRYAQQYTVPDPEPADVAVG